MKLNKTVKSIFGWILYLAILAGLVYGIPKALAFFLETDYPMASITSGSMWPSLKKGDLILIKGVGDKEEIGINDIIVYQNPKGFTIHRIIKMEEKTLTTKGDANNVEDLPVEYEKVIGKIFTINDKPLRIPFLGSVSALVNKK